MRKILFFIGILVGFLACKDDDELRFDVPVEFRKVEFQPVPGGAVMKYFVKSPEVYGVRVRYRDAWGELRTREGSYLGDTLLLNGFTEARQNVPAQVSLFNRSMVESESVEMTFNTENSATVALFDDLKVQEFWGGFSVSYTAPETVTGMVHVFYLGTNPLTGKQDSILVSSTPIKAGGDTLNFEMTQVMETTDVIVRTDDFDGKRVKLQVYEDLPCLSMDTLKYEEDFLYEFGGQRYNYTLVNEVENADMARNVDKRAVTQRWYQPGDITTLKDIKDRNVTTQPTSRFMQRNNTLTWNSVNVGYEFTRARKKMGLRLARLEVGANDLVRFSTIKTERGTSYPFARTFYFSLQANF